MHLISQARVWTARGIPTYHAGVFGQAWYYLFHILMSRCFLKRHQRIHWVLLLLWQSGLTGHHACYSEEYICFWNSSISFLCSPSCLPSSPLVQAIVLLCINTCLLLPLVHVQSFQLNLSLIICISLYECCNDSNYLLKVKIALAQAKQQAAVQQPISLMTPHAARDWFRYRAVPYSISTPNSVVPCLPSTARHAFVYSRCSPYPIRTGTVIWV